MRRNRALLVSVIALITLSACGASGGEKNEQSSRAEVPTLTTPEPDRSGSAQPRTERPRERLDTTAEEFEAMLGPYNQCMRENGVKIGGPHRSGGSSEAAPKVGTTEETEKYDAANRICEPQFYPLPPWEKDPANPGVRDFALGVVKCLKDKGVKYVEVSEDGISIALGGVQNDSRSISMGLDFMAECERKVAAESK